MNKLNVKFLHLAGADAAWKKKNHKQAKISLLPTGVSRFRYHKKERNKLPNVMPRKAGSRLAKPSIDRGGGGGGERKGKKKKK